jgi:fermentation-respiration switch protein FrsA (DUF1100 family)
MLRKVFIALFLFVSVFLFAGSRQIVEKGTFDLYLNGVKKGEETYKVAVDKKKDTYELYSELRFQYPYQQSKRGYLDLKVYPYYDAILSTGEFLHYEYRSKVEDFSKTDLVETEKSATELIDQDMRMVNVFDVEQQRTDDIMNDRIDLGVNAGYCYPAGKVLRFSQTRLSNAKKKDEKLPENLIILEPYGFCLYKLLADKLKGEGPKWEFTLAVPQLMRLKPCVIEYEGTLNTYVAGSNYILKHYNILINDKIYTSFWLDKDNTVVLVSVPTEGVTAVRTNYQIKPFEKEEAKVSKESIEISGGNFTEKDLHIECSSGTIGATLTLPEGNPPFPAVLLVQDFQPVDRDGNSPYEHGGKASPLKQIAFALSEKGMATLRFDSRGISESSGDPSLLTLEGRKNEIKALLKFLKENDKIDKNKIYIVSEGLGGWSAIKAISDENIKGIIFVAFPMKEILRIWREQISIMQNLEAQKEAYAELDSLNLDLQKNDIEWATFRGSKIHIPALKELSLFNPAEEIKNLKVKAIFVYPDKDNVILPFHGEILEKESAGKFKPIYLKGLGHSLTDVDEEGNQKALVNKNALSPIYDFILKGN